MTEAHCKKLFQIITLWSSVAFFLFLAAAGIREGFPEWRKYQKRYKKISIANAETDAQREAAKKMKSDIKQIVLDEWNKIDRCQTCHLGMDDARMAEQDLPYRTHSGNHLRDHTVADYGCTVCHDGQGQATDKTHAHARANGVDWPSPLLALDYVQSACGQCHLAIFDDADTLAGTEIFQRGLQVFRREGCLGCHKARGVGGAIGPDLTEQGKKTRHEYDFANIVGEQTVANWLSQHFKDPEMVSPGSEMLAIDLRDGDLQALITFTLGMRKPDIPFDYFSVEALKEFKGQRSTLSGTLSYPLICSACHGKTGQGKSYKIYKTGIPAIGRDDFLSVASQDFIVFSIYHGRGGRQMAAWMPRFSGLTQEEIHLLAAYLRSRRVIRSDFEDMSALKGHVEDGNAIYDTNCTMCHGPDGKGLSFITISNPDLMAAASNEFLFKTIVNGRGNTAMPAWGQFSSQEMAGLLAYLRPRNKVQGRRRNFTADAGDASRGEQKYHYICSRCHGLYGQGDTGPSIINSDFLEAASDYFLSEMIAKGRQDTAMIGWSTVVTEKEMLSEQNVADVIAFLRHAVQNPPDVIYPGPSFGSADAGAQLYQTHCVECHGRDGKGPQAPALNNQELLNATTNGYFFATIARGRKDTAMPSWGRGSPKYRILSVQERHDIVTYLRRWQKVVIKKRFLDKL
jgi:mono/diheme cytochrome c family protein